MTRTALKKYPVGIQTFSELRENGYLYIDKTAYVYRMTHANSKYMFLSRPRRFGKSLLTSTLLAYFEGRRNLFTGLAIEGLEKDWTRYPVLHFDMSTAKNTDKEALVLELERQLLKYESVYGRGEGDIRPNQRLQGLIERACQQTGQKAVVLIDEYDAPLLDVVHEEVNLPVLRNVMRNFYSPLKACDPYLRFVFLTGITKFSQLSIFSELNNIRNISMDEEYAAICGITGEEMQDQMKDDIEYLAGRLKTDNATALNKLKANYDGYHFTWPSPDIYNPYSLLNAFDRGRIDSYWFGSGTPACLIEMLRKFQTVPQEIGGRKCSVSDFDAPTEQISDITPLLYQSGYLTIKGYSPLSELYMLDIPNKEVRLGLCRSLIPNYVKRPGAINTLVGEMAECLHFDNLDGALRLMQKVLSTVPYCENTDHEGHYQQMLYLIFTLLGHFVDIEVRTPRGRVDVVMRTASTLYVMELKLGQNADAALQQIDLKDYSERFALCSLPIVKVGISFDRKKRTIGDWKIHQDKQPRQYPS